ncbi:hypothetical protein TIFTF001_023289 [Ficus carica]|uniref:Uncharacterized protein n=1 Tax=Ficus carica TaxID=3494 RepID=A0AA88DDK2_FICCA|nr:hypothetical protein TIFTF001_023289 [Ficus carica]
MNIPKRLRALSLWKEFFEIKTDIIKRVPSWVDWPFVIRGALRRLFGTPLFIEPLSDEDALIAELALDTMNVDFPNPKDLLARKRAQKEATKAEDEKSKRVPVKRKKLTKASTSETDVEPRRSKQGDEHVEVELLPGDRIQSHLDEFLWDGLKSNLRAMELVYRTTDKVVEQKARIKELEEIDSERGEKLLDIERRFKDVKASTDGLLVDADVEAEIELFEDSVAEAGDSLSAPVAAVSTANEPELVTIEPPSDVDLLEVRKKQ